MMSNTPIRRIRRDYLIRSATRSESQQDKESGSSKRSLNDKIESNYGKNEKTPANPSSNITPTVNNTVLPKKTAESDKKLEDTRKVVSQEKKSNEEKISKTTINTTQSPCSEDTRKVVAPQNSDDIKNKDGGINRSSYSDDTRKVVAPPRNSDDIKNKDAGVNQSSYNSDDIRKVVSSFKPDQSAAYTLNNVDSTQSLCNKEDTRKVVPSFKHDTMASDKDPLPVSKTAECFHDPQEKIHDLNNTFDSLENDDCDENDALSLFADSDFEDNIDSTENVSEKVRVTLSKDESSRSIKLSHSPRKGDPLGRKNLAKRLPEQKNVSLQNELNNEFISRAIIEANVFPNPIVMTNNDIISLIKANPRLKNVNVSSRHEQINKLKKSYDKHGTLQNRTSDKKFDKVAESNSNTTKDRDTRCKKSFGEKNHSNVGNFSRNAKSSSSKSKPEEKSFETKSSKLSSEISGYRYSEQQSSPPKIAAKRASNPYCSRFSEENTRKRSLPSSHNPSSNSGSLLPTPCQISITTTPNNRRPFVSSVYLQHTDETSTRKRKLDDVENVQSNKPRRISGDTYLNNNFLNTSLPEPHNLQDSQISDANANVDSFMSGFPKQDTDLRILFGQKSSSSVCQDSSENDSFHLTKDSPATSPDKSVASDPLLPTPENISKSNDLGRPVNPFATSGFRTVNATGQNQINQSATEFHSSNPFLLKTSSASTYSFLSQSDPPTMSGGFQNELPSMLSTPGAVPTVQPLSNSLASSSRSSDAGTPPLARSINKSSELDWSEKINNAIAERRYRDCVNIARDAYKRTELGTQKQKSFGERELSELVHQLGHGLSDYESAVLTACIESHPTSRVLTMLVDLVENFSHKFSRNEEIVKTIYKQFCKVLVTTNPSTKIYHSILDKFIIAFSSLGQVEKIWTILMQVNLTRISVSSFQLVVPSLLQDDSLSSSKPSWYKTGVKLAAGFTPQDIDKSAQLARFIAKLWLRCIELDYSDFLAIIGGVPNKPLHPKVRKILLDELEGLVVQCIFDTEYKRIIALIQAGSELLDDLLDIFVKGFSLLGDAIANNFEQFVQFVSTINLSNYFSEWCGFLKDIGYALMKKQSENYAWSQVEQIYACITQASLVNYAGKLFSQEDALLLNLEAKLKLKHFDEAYLLFERCLTRLENLSNPLYQNRKLILLKELLNYFLNSSANGIEAENLFWVLVKSLNETNIAVELAVLA